VDARNAEAVPKEELNESVYVTGRLEIRYPCQAYGFRNFGNYRFRVKVLCG
jgi:hypothetical protein